jgi:hypothetical protein
MVENDPEKHIYSKFKGISEKRGSFSDETGGIL